MKLIRNFVIIIASILGTFIGIHISSCGKPTKADFIQSKTDTSQTWLRYFAHIGNPKTLDTASIAIRIIKDTFVTTKADTSVDGVKFTKEWKRDTLYYVPYDSLIYKNTDSARRITIFILLPTDWNIYDYNKAMKIQTK